MRRELIAVFLIALAACNGSNDKASAPPNMDGLTAWSDISSTDIIVPEGVTYTPTTIDGTVVAQISNVPDTADSTGTTGGVGVRMPADIEAQASGERVQITLRASAAQEGAVLGAAYSTADVGNSGWQRFTLSAEPRDYVFAYNVRPAQAGNGDYVGLRSYGSSPVLIWGYRAEIVPPAPQPTEATGEPSELRPTTD